MHPRQTGQAEVAKHEATPREAVSTAVDEANAAVAVEKYWTEFVSESPPSSDGSSWRY